MVIPVGWRMIASAGYLDAKVTRDSVIAVGNRFAGARPSASLNHPSTHAGRHGVMLAQQRRGSARGRHPR
jgi:hypothetical protein